MRPTIVQRQKRLSSKLLANGGETIDQVQRLIPGNVEFAVTLGANALEWVRRRSGPCTNSG